ILDAAVWTPAEPLRVRFHVRMVGRALVREIERDFDPERFRGFNETAKVLERAEPGMHGLVPAFARADRPRAADVVGLCLQRVVLALALVPPDRVDRRQVQHVEAELRYVREPRFAV